MTAQANTAGNADAVTGQADQNGTLQPQDQNGTQLTETAHPAAQATPTQAATGGDLEREILTAEKRAEDKKAYLEKLQSDLRDMDRDIQDHKKQLKMATAPTPPQQQESENLSNAHMEAAKNLGISGEQFINLLRDNPDKALSDLLEVAEKRAEERVLGKIPLQLERHRIETEMRGKISQIRQDLGDEDFQIFSNTVAQYQQRGFTPTPDQVLNELRFGPPEKQRQLMEFGMLMLQQQQQPQQQEQPQTQSQQAGSPVMRPFPMAPGGGNPVQPQARAQTGNNGRLLPSSWNI